MFRTFGIGSVLGFPIQINPSWLITLSFFLLILGTDVYPEVVEGEAWLHWTLAGVSALFFCVCIILHELAHSLVARKYGLPVRAITLFALGGVSEITREPRRPRIELLMALAGPLTSVGLSLVFLGMAFAPLIGSDANRAGVMWEWLFLVNLSLGIVNLAPGFPLDGGRVLRAALWGITGNYRRATRLATWAGSGLGYALIGVGALTLLGVVPWFSLFSGLWFMAVGMFLDFAARQAWAQTRVMEALRERRVGDVMQTELATVGEDAPLLHAAAGRLDRRGELCTFVIDRDGSVKGLVSAPELVGAARTAGALVRDAMLPVASVATVAPGTDLGEALETLDAARQVQLAVLDDGRLVGSLSRLAILEQAPREETPAGKAEVRPEK